MHLCLLREGADLSPWYVVHALKDTGTKFSFFSKTQKPGLSSQA